MNGRRRDGFIDLHVAFVRGEPFMFISEEARRALVQRGRAIAERGRG